MALVRCLSALALVAVLAPAAAAQTLSPMPAESEGFTITPFVGIGFAGDYENAPTAFGLGAGWGLTPRVAVEGDLYFAPQGEQGELIEFDTSMWSLSANVLYHFTADDFTPYIAGGIGMMTADANAEDLGLIDDDTSSEFAWNWGGGVKSALSDRVGLRADLRFFNGDELAPDHWRLVGGVMIRGIGR